MFCLTNYTLREICFINTFVKTIYKKFLFTCPFYDCLRVFFFFLLYKALIMLHYSHNTVNITKCNIPTF